MNAPCNWVDLWHVGSVQFVCCELAFNSSSDAAVVKRTVVVVTEM